ncbi:ligand-binding sensor domain-containing protein [Granulicella tundricola]|uniref:Two component regulator propeller domain protein n=1 Tax=Granulicella tundricola (strain ATCC BAA-1859 / DSM 23138 / MP5ACTX9) TaxID=1198114 RepID=E8WWD5_GRATM|nr:hypothetical protein [Granulicella tundricola]ADW68518.1 hypothetical protein AciX9_1465 [Granulicella tundricola MP5ACTX9]
MRKVSLAVSAGLLSAVAVAACLTLWHVESSLHTIRRQVAASGSLPFDTITLEPASSHPLFEPVAPPDTFTTGASLAGKLYLAGPGGIASGSTWLRTGQDLPSAPIVALTTARLRGDPLPTLLAATQGQGLLILRPGKPIQQILPRDLAERDITALLPLASGALLLGTRTAGLLVYDGITLTQFRADYATLPITALAGDESDIWAGTRTRGVLHWHAGETQSFDQTNGLPDNQVEDIITRDGTSYVATPLGVAEFTNGRPTRTLGKGLFAHSLALGESNLMVATLDQGLNQIPLTAHSSRISLSNQPLSITHFFKADGTLFAISQDGLLRQDGAAGWQKITTSPSQTLSDRNVAALNFAPDGRLWVGYFDHGLDVLDLTTSHAEHVEDDHIFCVNRIVPDPQRHTMDVATANGLVLFDPTANTPKERQILLRKDGLISDQITDVAFTSTGMTLATPAGLTFFTPAGPQSLYTFQGLVNNHVYTLASETTSAHIVAGTLGGISVLDDSAVRQNLTLSNSGLKRNWITAIVRVPHPSASDTWFVGTYGGGITEVDSTGHVTPLNGANTTAVINPNAMLRTSQHIFAGSLESGLLVYTISSQHWSQITAGLPSRNVTAFAEKDGELYIGTDNGIVRVEEARLP